MKRSYLKQHKPMKRSRPKMTPIRKSAKGLECTMHIPGICNWDAETTVWCHSNASEDGKGMGLKSRDTEGCYGCSACHAFYDGGYAAMGFTRDEAHAYFSNARIRSQAILRGKGLMT